MHEKMLPMWDEQKTKWLEVIEKLPVQKYAHSRHSEHANRNTVSLLGTIRGQKSDSWYGIHKKYMPLPTTCMIYPRLRYLH